MLLLITQLALAALPTETALRLELGAGVGSGLSASPDGRFIGFVHGAALGILDVDSWEVATASPCAVQGVSLGSWDGESAPAYVACSDGTVIELTLADDAVSALASAPVTRRWTTGDASALGVWWDDAGGRLVALGEGTDTNANLLTVHGLDPADENTVDTGSFTAASLVRTGFNGAILQSGRLLISHSGDDVSTLVLGSSSAGVSGPMGVSAGDLAPWGLEDMVAVDTGKLMRFSPSTSMGGGTGQWTIFLSPLTDPLAVGTATDWVAVASATSVDLFDATGGLPVAPSVQSIPVDVSMSDMLVLEDEVLLGLSESGALVAFNSGQWVDDVAVSSSQVDIGSPLTVTFRPRQAGDWTLYLGGDRLGTGTVLAQGQATAGELINEVVQVDSSWVEGSNAIYILVDGSAGVAHERVDVVKDGIPTTPVLTSESVGFSDKSLRITMEGIPDQDLDHYTIFVSREPFVGTDYSVSGPAYNVGQADYPDDLAGPVTVADVQPGEQLVTTLSPLTNGVMYYVAVRAVDRGGKESAMSEVVSQTPESTLPPSQVYGEPGGPMCAPTGMSGVWWLAPLALLWRRRRAVGLAAAVLAPVTASAFELPKDETDTKGSFEVRWTNLSFPREDPATASAALDRAYANANGNLGGLYLEGGPSLFQIAELNFGLGLTSKEGEKLGADSGLPSGEVAKLTAADLAIGGTLRLQVLDEQPIVPFASIGWHQLMWREGWELADVAADPTRPFRPGNRDAVSGAFRGRHTSLGIDVLLDLFAPGRASLLEAQTGINDTFVTMEWRKQSLANRVGGAEPPAGQTGYDFSGDVWSIGLKLDF